MADDTITITVKFQGTTKDVRLPASATSSELLRQLDLAFDVPGFVWKLLVKGKKLELDINTASESSVQTLETLGIRHKSKLVALGTPGVIAQAALASTQKPDPTLRSLEEEEKALASQRAATERVHASVWGTTQDSKFKFCRFGSLKRFEGQTPHPFAARQLLDTLATDPGIISVMTLNELVVGSLDEMDPDDRLAAVTAKERGACLLGYNSGAGAKIYLRLRVEDGGSFLPYEQIVDTLLHELAHNVAGPHLEPFWRTFAKFKVTYLQTHIQRKKYPLRFPRPRSGAPTPGAASDITDATRRVQRNLVADCASNGALSPHERAAAGAVANEVALIAPIVQQLLPEEVTAKVERSAEERVALRNKQADILEQRLKKQRDSQRDSQG